MQITDVHLRQYQEEGYTLVRGLMPVELLDEVRKRMLEVVSDPQVWPANTFQWLDPTRYRLSNGLAVPGGIQRPALREQIFDRAARHPNLQAAMLALLRGPVELFTDQIGYRFGRMLEDQAARSFYHQDSYYWKLAPELGCNCWLPLDAVARNASALAVLPRTHEGWKLVPHEQYFDEPSYGIAKGHRGEDFRPFQRHRIPQAKIDFSKEVLFDMAPGDGLFFTNFTWHRSDPNRTGQDKLFYAIAFRRSDIGKPAGQRGASA